MSDTIYIVKQNICTYPSSSISKPDFQAQNYDNLAAVSLTLDPLWYKAATTYLCTYVLFTNQSWLSAISYTDLSLHMSEPITQSKT